MEMTVVKPVVVVDVGCRGSKRRRRKREGQGLAKFGTLNVATK